MLPELPGGPARGVASVNSPPFLTVGGYVTDFTFLFDQMVRSELAAQLNGFSVALIRITQNCPIGDGS
jgi:hypothetical protein